MPYFTLASKTANVPFHAYEEMKNTILGKKYTLSLAFVGPKQAQVLNKKYRKKTYTPNVLSFPLTKDTGEVYISLQVAKKEAKNFSMSYEGYVGFLFVHGLLHLKGLDHGDTMEKAEKKYCLKYALK